MGITIQFYSADPQELRTLLTSDDERVYDTLETSYLWADFSLHLLMPDDMDTMCQALSKRNPLIPSIFRKLLVEQMFYEEAESLTVLSDHFVKLLAELSENSIKQAALDWAATLPYQEPLEKTPAYQALLQLQKVAQDAIIHGKHLIMHLVG